MKPLLSVLLIIAASIANAKPVALIYNGEGACEDGCITAATEVAKKAGFKAVLVKPDALNEQSTEAQVKALFGQAKVWIQPGGIANIAIATMTPRLVNELISFVDRGGGYVGFCAGAFMAMSEIANSGNGGLGIFPGRNRVFGAWPIEGFDYSLEKVKWSGKERKIYFEGGPYFYGYEYDKNVEVVATYEGDYTATARTTYGKGRVFITGLHPEAPSLWTTEDKVVDPDGSDQAFAIEMIQWAGKTEKQAKKPIERPARRLSRRPQGL